MLGYVVFGWGDIGGDIWTLLALYLFDLITI